MTTRTILTSENPLLRQKAKKVTRFTPAVRQLVSDMFDTLFAAEGVGLAAPQIGVLQRIIVISIPAEYDENDHEIAPQQDYVLLNPEIISMRGEEEMTEGCLSVPGYRGLVKRATNVVIKGQDEFGRAVRYAGEGLLAQAFQHELDHLNGILYTDRLEGPDKLWRLSEEEETVQEDKAQGAAT